MRLAARAAQIEPSATFAITMAARAQRAVGVDVIELSAGESDFDTPEHVKAAAVAALERGETRYTPVDGTVALKQAISRALLRDYELRYEIDEIGVANGVKQVIFNALAAIVEPGDEVIVPAPYWPSYPEMVKLVGGVPRIASGSAPGDLRAVASARTRGVILNFPANPTGRCFEESQLRELADVLGELPDSLVIVDSIYERFSYVDAPFRTLLQVAPELAPRTLTVSGLSKSHAMTGWRIGYGAGPRELIRSMATVQAQTTSNPCSIAQAAAIAALDGPQDFLVERVATYQRRRDVLVGGLRALPGVRCALPDGAFYAFCDVSGWLGAYTAAGTRLDDDRAFARALLDDCGVAVVPGSEFGAPGFIRISFTSPEPILLEAVARLGGFLARLASAP